MQSIGGNMNELWKKIPITIRYALIGLLIGIAISAGITGIITGRQLHNLRESEAATITALAELEQQNQELSDSIRAIKAGLDSCTSAVAAVGKQVQQLGGAVQGLGTSVDTIKRDIGQIAAGQSEFDAKLSEFGRAISGLGQSIHGLAEPIHSATTGVQQASDELSGTSGLIEQAASILQGLPKSGTQGTK